MSRRRKLGRIVQVSAPSTVSEGRASRAKDARPLDLRRLDGEEGALAKLVFALSDPALFGEDGSAKDKAQERVRAARKRVRSAVGDEAAARSIFAHAVVSAGERRILASAHPTLRPHLVEQAVASVKTSREFCVESWTARTEVAVAARLLATGLALLDVGSSGLDVETLKAGAALVGQAQRMRDGALDTDRRAKAAHTPSSLPWLTAAPEQPTDERQDDEEHAASDDEEPAAPSAAPSDEDEIRDSRESLPDRPDPLRLIGEAPGKLAPNATEWSHALGRMVPRARPAPVAAQPSPSPQPSPARNAQPATPPLPPGSRMRQRSDGTWAMAPPPEPSRPSATALRQMRERGIDTTRWER